MTDIDPDYAAVAYIGSGRFAAMAALLAVLHAGGYVDAGRAGTVRRSDRLTPPPEGFERSVWLAIHGFVSPGALMARPQVDAAFNDLRRRCRRLRLIRPFLPVHAGLPTRTKLGRELVVAARRDCPWPPSPENDHLPLGERVGMPVAVFGDEALRLLIPAFARDSGLLAHASNEGLDWADPAAPGPWNYA